MMPKMPWVGSSLGLEMLQISVSVGIFPGFVMAQNAI